MKAMFLAAAAALVLTPMAAAAQDPAETTYIHAGRLLDRPGTAARGPSTVIVRDGKIAEVRDGHAAPEAGARLVDLKDKFVLPGLIDMHVHSLGSAAIRRARGCWRSTPSLRTT